MSRFLDFLGLGKESRSKQHGGVLAAVLTVVVLLLVVQSRWSWWLQFVVAMAAIVVVYLFLNWLDSKNLRRIPLSDLYTQRALC